MTGVLAPPSRGVEAVTTAKRHLAPGELFWPRSRER
jgi:hypothetical protein